MLHHVISSKTIVVVWASMTGEGVCVWAGGDEGVVLRGGSGVVWVGVLVKS